LDFLGAAPFLFKTPFLWGWISLEFLGFSRPNRAFSMSYAGFSLEIFSRALSPIRRAGTGVRGRDREEKLG
jgi:hypothetical protein